MTTYIQYGTIHSVTVLCLCVLRTHSQRYSPMSPCTTYSQRYSPMSPCTTHSQRYSPMSLCTAHSQRYSPMSPCTTHSQRYSPMSPCTTHSQRYSPMSLCTTHSQCYSPMSLCTAHSVVHNSVHTFLLWFVNRFVCSDHEHSPGISTVENPPIVDKCLPNRRSDGNVELAICNFIMPWQLHMQSTNH